MISIIEPTDVWNEVVQLQENKANELEEKCYANAEELNKYKENKFKKCKKNAEELEELNQMKFWSHLGRLPQKPKLVLSIIGDSSSSVPKRWRTSVLKTGLVETAKGAKDSLILYNGSNEQISTLVQDAVECFHSLYENNKDEFLGLIGLVPNKSSMSGEQRKKVAECEYWKKSYCVYGDIFQLGTESDNYPAFYANILDSISNKWTHLIKLKKELQIRIPVLTIVVGGDLKTIITVHEILQKGLPVLILKGSGNAADFIAEFHESDITVTCETFIAEKTALLFGISRDDNYQKLMEQIMEGIQKHISLITVIDIEKDTKGADFTDAVVRAIIGGWSKDWRTGQTDIALNAEEGGKRYYCVRENGKKYSSKRESGKTKPTRSRLRQVREHIYCNVELDSIETKPQEGEEPDNEYASPATLPLYYYLAYQFIQEIDNKNPEDKKKNYQLLLKEAIIADRVEYVSVLLENGVMFDPSHFPEIYKKTILRFAEQNNLKWTPPIAISKMIKRIQKRKASEGSSSNEFRQIGRMCFQSLLEYPEQNYTEEGVSDNEDVYEDLLLWSVIANRPKLATLFWTKSKNQLLGALLVSCIFKNMLPKEKGVTYQSSYDKMIEQSRIFADRALNLLSKLFMEDELLTVDLVMTKQTLWDITVKPFECAYENDMLDFISHSCFHKCLNKIWYKEIGATLCGFWKNVVFGGWGCCGLCHFRGSSRDEHAMKVNTLYTRNMDGKLTHVIQAPLIKFLVYYIFFLAALWCFSAFLLTELDLYSGWKSIHIYEWIGYAYFYGDLLEEYRILNPGKKLSCSQKGRIKLRHSRWYRIKKYMHDFWNFLGVLSYILLVMATCYRFMKSSSKTGKIARRLYSFSLFVMYMRFLRVLLMSRKIGPKLIMIKEMLKDLFRFIGILFVFMFGVGVLYHANMYPKHVDMWNRAGWENWRIWKIIQIPYWQMYGEPHLEQFQANSTKSCTKDRSVWESNPDIERCNEYDWVLAFISAIYMMISNLLLVNLVIALFSYRFGKVQENSLKLWRYHRYGVIMDFRTRIPTPLNFIIRPLMILARVCKQSNRKSNLKTKKDSDEKSIEKIETLQSMCAVQCAYGE